MTEDQKLRLLELIVRLREFEGNLFDGDITETYKKLSKLIEG